MLGAARTVHRVVGVRGFFQGLAPRLLYQAPSTAVSWSVYEFFKSYLIGDSRKRDDDYESIAEHLRPLPKVRAAGNE